MVNEWKQIAYKKLDADADTITLGATTAKAKDIDDPLTTEGAWWSADTADITYDATNDEIDWSADGTASAQVKYFDLQHASLLGSGNNASNTAWVLRCKVDLKNFTVNGNADWNQFAIGLGSANTDMSSAKDFLGFQIGNQSGGSDGYAVLSNNNTAQNSFGTAFTRSASAEILYVQMVRVSDTVFRVDLFSDSNYTNLLETQHSATITANTIQDLRYLIITTQRQSSETGTNNGSVDDIEFWNGTNTVVEGGFESHDMYKLQVFAMSSGGTLGLRGYINEDKGGSKSSRYSQDGASDITTGTEQSTMDMIPSVSDNNRFLESIILDFPNQEKLFINHSMRSNTLGAGADPVRLESVNKVETQVDRIISITISNEDGAGDIKKGSYAILYGANRPTITHANGNTLVEVQGDTI